MSNFKLTKLILKNFGPFINYELNFGDSEESFILLTGKNNEGKSTILNALKLVSYATKVLNKHKQQIFIEGDTYFKLFSQDIQEIDVGRMVYNYQTIKAEIIAEFSTDFRIFVYIDPQNNIIYADHLHIVPPQIESAFGIMPPLGPLAEKESIISDIQHLRASLNTSLAPRHLRNHFYHLLTNQQFELVRDIVKRSWEDIVLGDFELELSSNRIVCYYKEKRITREISWAGQGLQVWFQIITHLVRLHNSSILILDEPEIFLHPEKQKELIKILREQYNGTIIVATHSMEIMDDVNISHIINVKKTDRKPVIKSSTDRFYLETIRSQVGSRFNFIASQFNETDMIIFTEDKYDYDVITQISKLLDIEVNSFNIPLHGFNEYRKAFAYREAYEYLIGKKIRYSLVLDKDYYPDKYLNKIKQEISQHGIKVIYTPGKEIENLFLKPDVILSIVPKEDRPNLKNFIREMYQSQYDDCLGSFVTLHQKFLNKKLDPKTIITKYSPGFKKSWNNDKFRYKIVSGKNALKSIRNYMKNKHNITLSEHLLLDKLIEHNMAETSRFISNIYQ